MLGVGQALKSWFHLVRCLSLWLLLTTNLIRFLTLKLIEYFIVLWCCGLTFPSSNIWMSDASILDCSTCMADRVFSSFTLSHIYLEVRVFLSMVITVLTQHATHQVWFMKANSLGCNIPLGLLQLLLLSAHLIYVTAWKMPCLACFSRVSWWKMFEFHCTGYFLLWLSIVLAGKWSIQRTLWIWVIPFIGDIKAMWAYPGSKS